MRPDKNCKEFKNAISVEMMRKSDAYTIENFASGKELMFRAAKGIFDSVNWINKKIAIVCGSGNNGGDGYALSEILANSGFSPALFRITDKFSPDGKFYYDRAIEKGVSDCVYNEKCDLSEFDIIVDCIFGTGFSGRPKDIAESAINAINTSGAYVVSADINSGINGDTGEAEIAVKSDLTVSIGYYKKGMFLNKACELVGNLINVDIGIVLINEY